MSDMLQEGESGTATACECGRLDHQNQVTELPKGAQVKAVTDIAQLGENVQTGTKGVVTGHCSDGRAIVFFEDFPHGHTFHTPNGYIKVIASEHQVTKSGTCVIPGCPCRGWSAQETATEFDDKLSQVAKEFSLGAGEQEILRKLCDVDQPHQPAARGGGDEQIKVELINGVEGQCVAVNDYRICGPKPYGGGSVAKSWTTDKNDILRAFLTPDEKHAWLADGLQVVSVNQHQALVAERERLSRTLRQVRNAALVWADSQYLETAQTGLRQMASDVDKVLTSIEQRSTSE